MKSQCPASIQILSVMQGGRKKQLIIREKTEIPRNDKNDRTSIHWQDIKTDIINTFHMFRNLEEN